MVGEEGEDTCICPPMVPAVIPPVCAYLASLGVPQSCWPSCWRPRCRQAGTALTALEHALTELTVSGLLIYRLTIVGVTAVGVIVRHRCCAKKPSVRLVVSNSAHC